MRGYIYQLTNSRRKAMYAETSLIHEWQIHRQTKTYKVRHKKADQTLIEGIQQGDPERERYVCLEMKHMLEREQN